MSCRLGSTKAFSDTGNSGDISSRLAPLGAGGGLIDTNGNNVAFGTGLSGPGGLTKTGPGLVTWAFTPSQTGLLKAYTGPTVFSGGRVRMSSGAAPNVPVGCARI